MAIYCSRDCQTTHWPVHRTQCEPISTDGSASSASLSGAAESVRAAIPKLSQPPSEEEMNILYEKLLLRKGITKNEAQSFLVFYQNAKQGDAQAQTEIGWRYLRGIGVSKNGPLAFLWFQKAAEQGDSHAQTHLGWCYLNGFGIDQDEAQGIVWFQKAAEQEHPSAQSQLGWCYLNGIGVAKDETKGIFWLQKAIAHGDPDAQYRIGWCYLKGIGVAKDEVQSFFWLQKAAEQGTADAQYIIGWCYLEGIGVAKDEVQSFFWYTKAANQGHPLAQSFLALHYLEGLTVQNQNQNEVTVVPQDFRKAHHFASHAAAQGQVWGYEILGRIYSGVNQSPILPDDHLALHFFLQIPEERRSEVVHERITQLKEKVGLES